MVFSILHIRACHRFRCCEKSKGFDFKPMRSVIPFVSSRWTNLGERIRSLMDWIEQMETKITSTRDMHVEDLLAKLENVRLLALLTKGNLSHDYRCLIAQLVKQ